MQKLLTIILIIFGFLGTAIARADIVVLIHGYLGSPVSWQNSGVLPQLEAAGWKRAGVVQQSASGPLLTAATPASPSDHQVYSVSLPSKAPASLQADMLQSMLTALSQRHPDQHITLIGHSAGGVVARLALVKYGAGQVNRLITIASPHLGTGRAIQALDETGGSGPVGFVKSFFGGDVYHTVKQSTGLMLDLVPSRPGNMLYWLNSRQHPEVEYISIVRGVDVENSGDELVPGYSQDMNRVPALHGKSQLYFVPTRHVLTPADGEVLALLLESAY
ncbi:MAG: alpha/beta fold hydrolase [Chromatiales bacterium]